MLDRGLFILHDLGEGKYKCVSKNKSKIRKKSPNFKQKTPKKQQKSLERKKCQVSIF